MERITIDPVTRAGGNLRITATVVSGRIVDAFVSGSVARGFEGIIRGRDPRDAHVVMQRICGACTTSHGLAAARAVEEALGIAVPPAASLVRNLLQGLEVISSHVLHFYQMALPDYLDVRGILRYRGADLRLRAFRDRVAGPLGRGGLQPLQPGLMPDELTIGDPETVTMAYAGYFEALEFRKKVQTLIGLLGGKSPHVTVLYPGGVTQRPSLNAVTQLLYGLEEVGRFVNQVYLADVVSLATGPLLPVAQLRLGEGYPNYLSVGAFEVAGTGEVAATGAATAAGTDAGKTTKGRTPTEPRKYLRSGAILGAKRFDFDLSKPAESSDRARYEGTGPVHPILEATQFDVAKPQGYSFVRAPRYAGEAAEVGALARLIVGGDQTFLMLAQDQGLGRGVLARHVARAIECRLAVEVMTEWADRLAALIGRGRPGICTTGAAVPVDGEGVGLVEAPRGTLTHWVALADGRVLRYQVVTPTTWNGSPRDHAGRRGPIEQALIGTPVGSKNSPLNVLRVVRSFDPCMNCAVHLIRA